MQQTSGGEDTYITFVHGNIFFEGAHNTADSSHEMNRKTIDDFMMVRRAMQEQDDE